MSSNYARIKLPKAQKKKGKKKNCPKSDRIREPWHWWQPKTAYRNQDLCADFSIFDDAKRLLGEETELRRPLRSSVPDRGNTGSPAADLERAGRNSGSLVAGKVPRCRRGRVRGAADCHVAMGIFHLNLVSGLHWGGGGFTILPLALEIGTRKNEAPLYVLLPPFSHTELILDNFLLLIYVLRF